MAVMGWFITGTAGEFLAAAGECLRAEPARNSVVLTATENLRLSAPARSPAAPGQEETWFGWWRSAPEGQGPVSAVFMHTPEFPVMLSHMGGQAAAALACDLAAAGRQVPGVNAGQEAAGAFAAAWRDRTGDAVTIRLRMRLFRLGGLVPPRPAPGGAARLAARPDRDLLAGWFDAFAREIGDPPRRDYHAVVDERLGYGGIMVWEAGGAPVSVAVLTRAVAGMVRVGSVYTPPGTARARLRRSGHRGRQPGGAGRRRPGGGALHRPGQPRQQRLVPASGLPSRRGPRGPLLRARTARVRLHW